MQLGKTCVVCAPTCYVLVSAGLSLPAQHVDESWQSAEFFATKVGLVYVALDIIQ